MSRLSALSQAAKQAMFSAETSEQLITLVTIEYKNLQGATQYFRLADSYTQRISETDADVTYGVQSGGNNYFFLPLQITLPDESDGNMPRCSINISDVTRYLTKAIRELYEPPKVTLQLVLASQPNTIEASFGGLYITNITYSADTVQCQLEMINYASEPFPAYTFSPNYFPGLF
jgi:hypothetical protein